ncbi:MAG: hypothetical protein QM689_11175 [Oscillospiraceae bacterium]
MLFAIIGAVIGAGLLDLVLVSASRTKKKATDANPYITTQLQLDGKSDNYVKTTTTSVTINRK